jgi:hypothetical protein
MNKAFTIYQSKNSVAMARHDRQRTARSIISRALTIRKALFLLLLVTTAFWAPGGITQAQECRPAVVNYIVRDESGKELAEPALKSISEKLPEKIDEASIYIGEVYFAKDGKAFYSPYSSERKKGKMVRSLSFGSVGPCIVNLKEATLSYHGKRMRLVFNIDINRRNVVVESLPFQEGTFELDLTGWSLDQQIAIPATRWKKVSSKA